MTFRSTQLRFATLALAIAAVSLTGLAARAFTMENLNANPDGSSRFTDPGDQAKNFGQSAHPFGQNGPVVQFGAGSAIGSPIPPFGRFQSFGSTGPQPPQPYAMPLGNGN